MFFVKFLFYLSAIVAISNTSAVKKRGVFDGNFGNFAGYVAPGNEISFGSPPSSFPHQNHENTYTSGPIILAKPIVIHNMNAYPPVSPAEIASAISAAKEATSQVLQAQQRVQFAKEAVLSQQRIASQKEAHASIAAQKAEAAAAVQRQEANAAASAVVLAQQRLAQAKAEVAEHQRIAASKEAHAAHVIQKSASAAAEQIQKSEDNAAKLAAFQRSEASVYKHASAAKDSTLSAASAAVAASATHYPQPIAPWLTQAISSVPIGPWH